MTAWRSLTNKYEFHEVYERGAKQVGRFLVVYLLPADDMARAVVASRKVGGAVQRNRAKRLMREAFHHAFRDRFRNGDTGPVIGIQKRPPSEPGSETGGPPADRGLWVVLVARRNILGASSREVGEELDHLLGQFA